MPSSTYDTPPQFVDRQFYSKNNLLKTHVEPQAATAAAAALYITDSGE